MRLDAVETDTVQLRCATAGHQDCRDCTEQRDSERSAPALPPTPHSCLSREPTDSQFPEPFAWLRSALNGSDAGALSYRRRIPDGLLYSVVVGVWIVERHPPALGGTWELEKVSKRSGRSACHLLWVCIGILAMAGGAMLVVEAVRHISSIESMET